MKKLLLATPILVSLAASAQEAPMLLLEAENARLTPPVKVKRVNGYSGNAYVGDFDNGSVIRFDNVSVDKEGTYEFRIYYTSMFMRSVYVTINSYPAINVAMTSTTEDWNRPPVGMMLTYVWLDKGVNTILVTPPAGGGPNIDKFELWATDVEMPRPETSKGAYGYDLTDDAVSITVNGVSGLGSALADNDIATVYNKEGRTGYVEYVLDTPHLITGYLLSEGAGAEKQGTDWSVDYSVNGKNYIPFNPSSMESLGNATLYRINRQPHADKSLATRYFRVDTKGRDVAEIQLFGIPYISGSTKNFPVDATEGLNIESHVSGTPLGETEWADERCFNLFDRNMQTKYYTSQSLTGTVEIELDKPIALESYTLTSCQDYPERDPRSWTVEGFDRRWETVSEVRDFEFPSRYATMRFISDASKLYRGFRLKVSENNGGDRFQLLKWQLFGSATTGVEAVDADAAVVSVTVKGSEIEVNTLKPMAYAIHTVDGRMLESGVADGSVTFDLTPDSIL